MNENTKFNIGHVTAIRTDKEEIYKCSFCNKSETVKIGDPPKKFVFQIRLNDTNYARCESCLKDVTISI